ncbi:unnamed protein product [Zymoseptoria tritici ST99CH_1A5]|uniref:Uncharacterized protein n=3 Tax=Zymoseptoria tritici TaxID=1047171 RepID=A0A1X7RXZ9_ZYMT9|nr:unnamed protein product [Zymoseptoria tritici ST99CH_3D7]SMR55071.1 unnamed protein product [Zymoseptoria tritici ST99CH_1E4]SMR57458.1 unnamed protein product [Zymoseptoria tritici ST99CH_3D1]SMY25897.1 unnamed protein product [Zymoseptoria tritici ST99CH_1A5]
MSYVLPAKMQVKRFPANFLPGETVLNPNDNKRSKIIEKKYDEKLAEWTYKLDGSTGYTPESKLSNR